MESNIHNAPRKPNLSPPRRDFFANEVVKNLFNVEREEYYPPPSFEIRTFTIIFHEFEEPPYVGDDVEKIQAEMDKMSKQFADEEKLEAEHRAELRARFPELADLSDDDFDTYMIDPYYDPDYYSDVCDEEGGSLP